MAERRRSRRVLARLALDRAVVAACRVVCAGSGGARPVISRSDPRASNAGLRHKRSGPHRRHNCTHRFRHRSRCCRRCSRHRRRRRRQPPRTQNSAGRRGRRLRSWPRRFVGPCSLRVLGNRSGPGRSPFRRYSCRIAARRPARRILRPRIRWCCTHSDRSSCCSSPCLDRRCGSRRPRYNRTAWRCSEARSSPPGVEPDTSSSSCRRTRRSP